MRVAIFDTGVLALECCFNDLMSDEVYIRLGLLLFPLTTSSSSFSSIGVVPLTRIDCYFEAAGPPIGQVCGASTSQ
jgi:hypothetical protein